MIKSDPVVHVADSGYTLAGWLAIAQAVLLVPQVLVASAIGLLSVSHPAVDAFVATMSIVGLAVGVYVLYMFRRLLNDRFNFHGVDVLITALILVNCIAVLLGLAGMIEGLEVSVGIITAALLVLYGIVSAVFGIKLFKLEDNLFGLLIPFALLTIASGVCIATFLLAPIGVVTEVGALVIQGIIFLKAREERQYL
jgi:hypothetical protein